jgi:hypothetical protein
MAERQPITWTDAREGVAHLHLLADTARDRAREAVLSPEPGRPADVIYVQAFADLLSEVGFIHGHAERLLERLAEATPPKRSLEAVLVEIEAEGHLDIDLQRYHWTSGDTTWRCETSIGRDEPEYPKEGTAEERAAWRERAERGYGRGQTPLEAAEQRLAEIRELHAKNNVPADDPGAAARPEQPEAAEPESSSSPPDVSALDDEEPF